MNASNEHTHDAQTRMLGQRGATSSSGSMPNISSTLLLNAPPPRYGCGLVSAAMPLGACRNWSPRTWLALRYTPKMSNARVSRALYRSILKEIRSLTLAKGRRVLLLEEPDHRKWGHGQVDGCFA